MSDASASSANAESKPTIRPADDGDVEALVRLWGACGLTRLWNDPRQDIAFARRGPNSEMLVAERNGHVVSSAMVGHDGHRGAVYYVAADPAHRGKGLGRLIMKAAEDWLIARGVWKLNLLVRKSNRGVIGFYQGMVYAEEGVIEMGKRLRG